MLSRSAACTGRLALAIALAPLQGSAQPSDGATPPIRLEYAVHPGCPGPDVFWAQVMARTPRARAAVEGEPAQVLIVFVLREGEGSRGVVRVVVPDGTSTERSFLAPDCAEVVRALALVAALTVDPDAERPTPPGPALVPKRSEPAPPPSFPTEHRRGPVPPDSPGPVASPARRSSPRRMAVGLGFSLEAARAPSPGWMLGGRAHAVAVSRTDRVLSPELRLSATRATSSPPYGSVPTSFSWTAARIEGCPLRIALDPKVILRPCLFFDVGVLQGEAGPAPGIIPKPTQRPWLAGGLLGRVGWSPTPALVLEAQAGATVPLLHDVFEIWTPTGNRAGKVHEVPWVAAVTSLGLTAVVY